MRFLYSLVFYLATPLVLLHFAWRGRQDRRWLHRWGERFGKPGRPAPRGCVLIHAASVGEVNAASSLIEALLAEGKTPVFVTTFTPTGSQRLRDLFGDRVGHAYLPLDLPGACRRFLRSLSPRLLLIMETEVWPNLFHQAGRSAIPVMITNAQISARSLRAYRRFIAVTRDAFKNVSRVLAASNQDAERFIACGAEPSIVSAKGNIKFDLSLPASLSDRSRRLRGSWGNTRPVIVAGSTHEADEAAVLKAFRPVLDFAPEALLVLVPRHPERFDTAAKTAAANGLEVFRYSAGGNLPGSAQCLVVDVMGELQAAYGAADLAIIGGSFSGLGGHNPLEAAMLGVPVLTGPDMTGQSEIYAALVARGAARPVPDAAALGAAILELLRDARLREKMGESGRVVVEENRGALQRTLETVNELLEQAPDGARAGT